MNTVADRVKEARGEWQALDRAAKEKHVQAEKWVNDELGKFQAEHKRLPGPTDELFGQIDAALRERDDIRQQADNLRASMDQLVRVAGVGAYSGEDVAGGLAREAGAIVARRLSDRIIKSERMGEMHSRLARGSGDTADAILADLGAAGGRFKLGALLTPDEFEAFAMAGRGGMSPRATTLTGGGSTSAGPFIINDFQQGFVVGYARKQPIMLGLVGVGQTNSDTVEFVRQTAVSSAAAEVAEDTAAAEATIAYETVTSAVKEIAQFVPATRRALMDAPGLQATIENDLLGGVVDRIDTQIATGNGSGQNLTGIYSASGINTFALNAYTRADALHHIITLLSIQAGVLGEPDAIGLYPSDWEDLRLAKDGDGNYLMGPPNIPGPRNVFGVPAPVSTVFTNGTPLGGMFGTKARAWIREAPTVYVGYDGNDFTKRRISILAEVRLAFETLRPTAFCTLTAF